MDRKWRAMKVDPSERAAKEISARNHCIWYFRKWRRVQLVRGNVSIRVGLCEKMLGQH